jgi:O-antigen ligase
VGGFALAVLLLELVLAHGIVGPEISHYVFLFVGLFVVALAFRFPLGTALVFLGLTDFIFYPLMFARDVGALSVRPHEVALACLLVLAVVRPKSRSWGGTPGIALAVFLGLVSISALVAIKGGATSLSDAFNWARPLSLLTFFYVVVRLFPSTADRRLLLTGAAVLAAATGVVAALISFGGAAGLSATLTAPGTNAIRSEVGAESIERVRLAGLSAGYALFWFCVVQATARRGATKVLWLALLGGIALDIAVSLNRNMYLGLLIGALLMVVLAGSRVRNKMATGAAIGLAGLALLMVFGSSTNQSSVVQPILKRGETILQPSQTTAESSLDARAKETSTALETAKSHLLLGVGAGAEFGVLLREPISTGSFIIGTTQVPQLYLHNQYLYLVLIAGIPGLIAFLVFLGLPLLHAFRRAPKDAGIVACGVGIAMIMISSVVAIYFSTEDMTAILGLLAGVIVADREGRAADGESSGLVA